MHHRRAPRRLRLRLTGASCLLAHWYYKAVAKALEGDAKRKYFEHAGALLTADGTDDELVKLEAAPKGYQLVVPRRDCRVWDECA